MSKRPSRDKKINRLRKALRRTPPPYIDLIDWLETHGYAGTAGQARKIILDGRVKRDSHTLGIATITMPDGSEHKMVERYVPAENRKYITVSGA